MAGFKFTTKFVLQQTQNNTKPTPLRCYVRFNNTRCIIPTGVTIEPRYWNPKAQEPRQVIALVNIDQIKADLVNIKTWVKQAFDTITDKTSQYPEIETLKEDCLILIKNKGNLPGIGNSKAKPLMLFDYIDNLIADSKSGKRVKPDGSRLTLGTIKHYTSSLKVIKRFAAYKGLNKLDFDDINLDFYYDLKQYCYDVEKFTDNYFGSVIKFLRTCMNESFEDKIHNNQQHNSKRFVTIKVDIENVYLSKEQLEHLAVLDLTKKTKLDRVRDLFLVGCWTGLRFSDFSNIKAKNIDGDFIEIKTRKTGETVAIPIHRTVRAIMDKYVGKTANSLPPAISNQKMNEYLKDLCKEAEFNEMISLQKSRSGNDVTITEPLHDLISTHTARRAFASNMFKMGIPTMIIMAITGHKTEKSFYKYIKVTPRDKAEMMKEIWSRQTMKAV